MAPTRALVTGCAATSFLLGCVASHAQPTPEPLREDSPGRDGRSAPTSATTERMATPYDSLVAELRHSHSVIPPQPPVHPYRALYNPEAIIPPMCYTRTEGRHNPCYVCHQDAIEGRPNRMNDAALQRQYSFSEVGLTNHWSNLFEDRRSRINAISDQEILQWIAEDNYSPLPGRLREARFGGYIPDLGELHLAQEAFDAEGFAKDGSHWVAYRYKPLPSTFWPTNGSTDDAMIRLPAPYRQTVDGQYSRDAYRANLAILEARIKGLAHIRVSSVDERAIDADLNGDGELGVVKEISKVDQFVAGASEHISLPHLYPLDTEFLHSVRYVQVSEAGELSTSHRMKELRYMRKRFMLLVPQVNDAYSQEQYDKQLGRLPGYIDRGDYGLDNEMGWVVSGFIEGVDGQLRVNTYEENLFCMGCHSSVGSTIDKTFSFPRKMDGPEGWGYMTLRGMPDAPTIGESQGEIETYLQRAGGGGEFRSNPEMQRRWFSEGRLDRDKLAQVRDVHDLLTPSRRRALQLNKAYRTIVADQDYIYGRDATIEPPANVYRVIDNEKTPTLPADVTHAWDIRLDWARAR